MQPPGPRPPMIPPPSPVMGPPGMAPPPTPTGPQAVPMGLPPGMPPPPPSQPVPAGPPGNRVDIAAILRKAGIDLPPDDAIKGTDLGRRSPRGDNDHIYEIVAHDLARWLDRMPKILATAMKGGPYQQAPFKVPATGKQKYEVFKAKLFNDDGSVNVEGRQELLRRMTPKQYAQVVHIVTRQMKKEGGEMVEDDDE